MGLSSTATSHRTLSQINYKSKEEHKTHGSNTFVNPERWFLFLRYILEGCCSREHVWLVCVWLRLGSRVESPAVRGCVISSLTGRWRPVELCECECVTWMKQSRACERASPPPPLSQTCINPHPPPHGSKQHKCPVRVRWRCLRGWLSLVTHSPHRWPQGRDGWSAEGRQGGTLNKNFVCCNAVKATFCYTASQSHTVRGWRTSTISHLNEVDLRVCTCFLQILRLLSIKIPWKCSALLLSFLHPRF